MAKSSYKRIGIFYRNEMRSAKSWERKIKAFIKKQDRALEVFRFIKLGHQKPDLLIILGGDGTILEASRLVSGSGIPVLGLNLGRVGFLASVREEKNFLKGVKRAIKGRFFTDERILLQGRLIRGKKSKNLGYALNEFHIKSPVHLAHFMLWIDGHPVKHISGDGIIVATPTGSTGYAMSAGGPIVMPSVESLIVRTINAHTLYIPPLVLEKERMVMIGIEGSKDKKVFLSCDGAKQVALKTGDRVEIQKADVTVTSIKFSRHYFFESLRLKFGF